MLIGFVSLGQSPTKSTSESPVAISKHPWENGGGEGKYSYHPGGNQSAEPKDAPSAVNVVVVPNVDLPKVRFDTVFLRYETIFPKGIPTLISLLTKSQGLHEKYNKWGKDGY